MGKVEKVIVLSVLFLVALILVVTVTVDDPLDKTNVVEAGAKKGAPAVAQAPAAAPAPAAPLLSSTIQPQAQPPVAAAPVVAAPAPVVTPAPTPAAQPAVATAPAPALPAGTILKRLDGLEDSWFEELKLYTWKEGDTWRELANTYYGDWMRLDLLKRHNEGRMDVQPGEKVFVPVFANGRAMAASAQPADEVAASAKEAVAEPSAKPTKGKGEPKAAAKPSGKKFHTVANGESLWKIAKLELGDGNRWKEIYEANRDLLDKPESIKKGMRLRIP